MTPGASGPRRLGRALSRRLHRPGDAICKADGALASGSAPVSAGSLRRRRSRIRRRRLRAVYPDQLDSIRALHRLRGEMRSLSRCCPPERNRRIAQIPASRGHATRGRRRGPPARPTTSRSADPTISAIRTSRLPSTASDRRSRRFALPSSPQAGGRARGAESTACGGELFRSSVTPAIGSPPRSGSRSRPDLGAFTRSPISSRLWRSTSTRPPAALGCLARGQALTNLARVDYGRRLRTSRDGQACG